MRFQANTDNAVYVFRQKDVDYDPRTHRTYPVRGISARFGGRNRVFDSDLAAKTYRWSDEDKVELEKYLLSHEDFGNSIYLLDGEVPDYLVEFYETIVPVDRQVFRRCARISYDDNGDIDQCPNKAIMGKDFCEEHLPTRIVQGLGTTADVGTTE